jgi:hypothetical protein
MKILSKDCLILSWSREVLCHFPTTASSKVQPVKAIRSALGTWMYFGIPLIKC